MISSFKSLCFNIWKSKYDRKGIKPDFKPEFIRYIGVENDSEYNSVLATLYKKSNECPYSLFFDSSIPMQAEFDIITYVGNELKSMDVKNMKHADITMFDDNTLNNIFLESLDNVVNLALGQENFFNESSRNDFILKLIVWTYSYIRPISSSFDDNYSPKCFYYGDITQHEIYFLIMLHLMTFDVIYINPLREEFWDSIDKNNISEKKVYERILPIETLSKKIENSPVIELEESVTLQMQREMEETLFTGSGVYRSWQFKDGNVRPLFIQSTIIDLMNNYDEPARVRRGFKTENKTVTVPNYLFQIDGLYSNSTEYYNLIHKCISTPNTMILTDKGESLIQSSISEDEKLKLVFCKLSDDMYSIEELKKLSFYSWNKYRDSLEDFILSSINKLFSDCLFKDKLNQTDQFNIISDILLMNHDIIKMVDNFDFTDKIPKIVLFLENEDFVSDRILYLLGFIHELGFDIVIFNPSGLMSIDTVFNKSQFSNERLDIMKYNCTLESVKKSSKQKGNFFSKLFM